MKKTAEPTTTTAAPDLTTIHARIAEIETQLDTARQACEAHMAEGQARILAGADVLSVEAEAAGLRGNVAALESALVSMNTMLADTVRQVSGEHARSYARAHTTEAEALRVLAADKLAVAVGALDIVLVEAQDAGTRLELARQASNALLGVNRLGMEHIPSRGLTLLDRLGPLRSELDRLAVGLRT